MLTIAGIIASKHWDNFLALYAARTNTTENIVAKAETSKQNQQETLEKHGVYVKPPTLDEMEGLINGNISLDDFKNQLGMSDTPADMQSDNSIESDENTQTDENNQSDKDDNPTQKSDSTPAQQNAVKPKTDPVPSQTVQQQPTTQEQKPAEQEQPKPETQEQPKPTAQELIDAAVKELYSYEAELLSKLGEMKKEALKEYYARGGTHDDLIAVGMEGLDKCYVLESEADVKVKSVLDKLKTDLESIGADSTITKELWEYYCDEKVNSKTYYMNKYL